MAMFHTSESSQTRQGCLRWIDTDPKEIQTLLRRSKAVLVMTGAGISTSAGIPDFRSSNGLYAKGHIFDQTALRDAESRYRSCRSALTLRNLTDSKEPTDTHRFLMKLRECGILIRCYTQNIDMLETKAGLSTGLEHDDVDCVQLHGSLCQLRCSFCSATCSWTDRKAQDHEGWDIPCPYCTAYSESRKAAGRRQAPIGILLPDIIRTGQQHIHGDRIAELANTDQESCPDIFLILGTSLKAYGAYSLAKQFARATRNHGGKVVFVNIEHPRTDMHGLIDFWEPYDCDAWAQHMMAALEPFHESNLPNNPWGLSQQQDLVHGMNALGSTVWNPIILD